MGLLRPWTHHKSVFGLAIKCRHTAAGASTSDEEYPGLVILYRDNETIHWALGLGVGNPLPKHFKPMSTIS